MRKQHLALLISGSLLVASAGWLGHWTSVQAQTSRRSAPTPLPVALTTGTSSSTYRPADLEQSDNPTLRAVSGADNRVPVLSEKFPWAAVGRIDWIEVSSGETVGTCTGTLIGRDLVLTNSHCLAPQQNNYQPLISKGTDQTGRFRIVFKPNLIEGNFVETDLATVVDYQYGWETGAAFSNDWALLRINKPLGDKYGYLGWRSLNLNDPAILGALNNNVILAGYSSDYPDAAQSRIWNLQGGPGATAGVHLGCSIEKVLTTDIEQTAGTAGLFVHSCDSHPGSSGSAIMAKFDDGNYYVIGLHNSDTGLPLLKSNEICELLRNRQFVTTTGCANMGVQVLRWASQAAAMR